MKIQWKTLTRNIWNIPNMLTLLRLVLIPVFLFFAIRGNRFVALGVFLAACFTDLLDGYLARKHQQITDFGKLMDPLADKLMVTAALLCRGCAGAVPWTAIIIVLLKECLMILGSIVMLKRGIVVYANWYGKAAQVLFILGLTLSFFRAEFSASNRPFDQIMIWLAVAFAIIAMLNYAYLAWKALRKQGSKGISRP